ncbi:MAG: peptidoglycan DD-metalloendopeptidase family protein, partial [Phaeodactylibacter sp.]|nr:peptidoglycan DD-metalloendopeptidase family protein [Phaeodactylibacter sp.]
MEKPNALNKLFAEVRQSNKWTLTLFILAGFLIGGLAFWLPVNKKMQASIATATDLKELGEFPIVIPNLKYGFALDTFQVFEGEIQPNEFLSDLLGRYHVDYVTVDQLARNSKEVLDIRLIRAGKAYTILTKDSTAAADYFIYDPSPYEYFVFELKDDLQVHRVERAVDSETITASGVVESSLWQTMVDNGLSYEVTAKMEDALQWSVDFHHIQKGDEFRLLFDQNYIEGEKVGVGKVYAAIYNSGGTEYQAIWYENENYAGYYDLQGRPMKKTFLKAPVKYSRISSRYNMNRFHPVLKRRRPHLGTDYAAPYGTPIYAVADGTVTTAGYTNGNGRFVKIRHDKTYETQYLHMQNFAKGIKGGVKVRQGDVIGYVGSTG